MNDLVVEDAEYLGLIPALNNFASTSSIIMAIYHEYLDSLRQDSITGGEVAKNLALFTQQVSVMDRKTELLVDDVSKELRGFLDDIEEADRYLYHG